MKKKKEIPETPDPRPLNFEELPAGEDVDWNAFGRADLIFGDNGDEIEAQLKEEQEASLAEEPQKVRPEVLRYTALAVMSEYNVTMWTEKRAFTRMEKLSEAVTSAVKAVCPGKTFGEADVTTAILAAVKMKKGDFWLSVLETQRWQKIGISLADSVASLLNTFRNQLPDAYRDNPVIGWSIRNDGCTFIFRDGQKKVVEL